MQENFQTGTSEEVQAQLQALALKKKYDKLFETIGILHYFLLIPPLIIEFVVPSLLSISVLFQFAALGCVIVATAKRDWRLYLLTIILIALSAREISPYLGVFGASICVIGIPLCILGIRTSRKYEALRQIPGFPYFFERNSDVGDTQYHPVGPNDPTRAGQDDDEFVCANSIPDGTVAPEAKIEPLLAMPTLIVPVVPAATTVTPPPSPPLVQEKIFSSSPEAEALPESHVAELAVTAEAPDCTTIPETPASITEVIAPETSLPVSEPITSQAQAIAAETQSYLEKLRAKAAAFSTASTSESKSNLHLSPETQSILDRFEKV